jgi:hypothetical protein
VPDNGQLDAILDATQNVDSSSNCIDQNIQIADDANNIAGKPSHAPNSVPSNIEWAKYLTSIDDIIHDVNGPDPNGTTSLDSLTASLINPLESNAVDIQNHVINTFSLNEYARLAHILPVPSCSNLKPYQPSVRSPINPSTASLYLIPLSHDIARYRPFDRCKEFVDFLKDQPNYLQTILEDVSEYAAVKEQRTISFRPKYEQPKPAELTLKQKIEMIRTANIEIPIMNGSPMKRPRKTRPSIITESSPISIVQTV